MKYGSVCSGIEAASVAWHGLGWQPAWFSEIAPFPSAVLAHHYPTVINYGDMTNLVYKIFSETIEAPEILCGGTPCQAFSISGNRQSLEDNRGNLSLEFCRIADAIDNVRIRRNEPPCIILWENVPGVLSTHDNAFGCFLAGLAGELPIEPPAGKWPTAGVIVGTVRSVAWRVLDAQYFGLAQRRKRVFVVASSRTDIDIGQILFEFEGVQRVTKPSREKGQGDTRTITHGVNHQKIGATITKEISHTLDTGTVEGVIIGATDIAPTLRAEQKQSLMSGSGDVNAPLAIWIAADDTSYTLRSSGSTMNGSGNINSPLAISIQGNIIDRIHGGAQGVGISTEDISYTLTTTDRHAVAFKVRGQGHYTGENNGDISKLGQAGGSGLLMSDEKTFTIATSQDQYILWQARMDGVRVTTEQDTVLTLTSFMGTGGNNVPFINVRRLTPRECERLQGFPDDYTLIPYKGKEASDAVRYHALGNSWAVPVITWIGQRIEMVTK